MQGKHFTYSLYYLSIPSSSCFKYTLNNNFQSRKWLNRLKKTKLILMHFLRESLPKYRLTETESVE